MNNTDKIAITQFKLESANIYKSFFNKRIEINNYSIYNVYTNIIFEIIPKDVIKKYLDLYDSDIISYDEYLNAKKDLDSQSRTHDKINLELEYKYYHQTFEEYLAEIIYKCLFHFPKYMKTADSKNDIPFDKIFNDSSSIEDIKDFMITYRVKQIIQSNNIVEAIKKFEKIFSFKFNLDNDDLNKLYISCLNRNILVHNNGIVNEIYLNQIKSRDISTSFIKGDDIFELISKSKHDDRTAQDNIAKKIYSIIIKDSERLYNHHQKII